MHGASKHYDTTRHAQHRTALILSKSKVLTTNFAFRVLTEAISIFRRVPIIVFPVPGCGC